MDDFAEHSADERNAQRALVIALAYPLAIIAALLIWGVL